MKETMERIRNQNADKSLLWFWRLTGVVLFALGGTGVDWFGARD